tara:strand:+ start:1059 stop:1259 length:201 start_codon:yes stop_codon:yes gene_type:complete
MKITATIQATVKVKEDENPDEAHDKVIQKLADMCEEWLEGTMAPRIKIEYTLDNSYAQEIKKQYLN